MNTTLDDGGPMFPTDNNLVTDRPGEFLQQPGTWPGMSLRDYFAGMALQGILANQKTLEALCQKDEDLGVEAAGLAFEAADRMLAERKEAK